MLKTLISAAVLGLIAGITLGLAFNEFGANPQTVQAVEQAKPADEIRTRTLIITDAEDRNCITLHGMNGGGGMWIGRKGKIVGIYSDMDGCGPVISLMNTEAKNACPLALSLDTDGKPSIQFEDKSGKLHWIGPDDLEKLAK